MLPRFVRDNCTTVRTFELTLRSDTSILDAATNGALAALPIVLGIIANIVAFISFIAFTNAMLSWFGGLVGYEALSLEVTCPSPLGYLGRVVAFLALSFWRFFERILGSSFCSLF